MFYHKPGRWVEALSSSGRGWLIETADGAAVAYCADRDDVRRIIACVNACDNVPTTGLEANLIKEFIKALEAARTALKAVGPGDFYRDSAMELVRIALAGVHK